MRVCSFDVLDLGSSVQSQFIGLEERVRNELDLCWAGRRIFTQSMSMWVSSLWRLYDPCIGRNSKFGVMVAYLLPEK